MKTTQKDIVLSISSAKIYFLQVKLLMIVRFSRYDIPLFRLDESFAYHLIVTLYPDMATGALCSCGKGYIPVMAGAAVPFITETLHVEIGCFLHVQSLHLKGLFMAPVTLQADIFRVCFVAENNRLEGFSINDIPAMVLIIGNNRTRGINKTY
jgi:hypothetical protein